MKKKDMLLRKQEVDMKAYEESEVKLKDEILNYKKQLLDN